jgi:hypothetical protein
MTRTLKMSPDFVKESSDNRFSNDQDSQGHN